MKSIKLTNQVLSLLSQDKIRESINLLKNIITDNEELKILVVQSARYTDVVKKIHLGIIEETIADIEKNKIRIALISLATEIEEQYEHNPNLLNESNQSSINQIHHGTGDNVAGDKIIKL